MENILWRTLEFWNYKNALEKSKVKVSPPPPPPPSTPTPKFEKQPSLFNLNTILINPISHDIFLFCLNFYFIWFFPNFLDFWFFLFFNFFFFKICIRIYIQIGWCKMGCLESLYCMSLQSFFVWQFELWLLSFSFLCCCSFLIRGRNSPEFSKFLCF